MPSIVETVLHDICRYEVDTFSDIASPDHVNCFTFNVTKKKKRFHTILIAVLDDILLNVRLCIHLLTCQTVLMQK